MKSLQLLVWMALASIPLPLFADMSVTLTPSVQLPAPVGTSITWTATVSGAAPGTLWYRFGVRSNSTQGTSTRNVAPRLARARDAAGPVRPFQTIVDYGPNPSLDWSTVDGEGAYEFDVSARNVATGETAEASVKFWLTSRVTAGTPVITATAHPLVFIYSAPACTAGNQMRVQFQSPDSLTTQTPYSKCDGVSSMNFYLAGMRPGTSYTVQHLLADGTQGPQLSLTTGAIPMQLPRVVPLAPQVPSSEGLLLQSVINSNAIATDLKGNIVWYSPAGMSLLTRMQAGGKFLGILEDGTQDPSHQFFREYDLAGVTRAETNAARVSEQLAAMGMHPVNSFHHEAIEMPDGRFLVMAGSERVLSDVQGPGPVDILGDTIIVFDRNLHVIWAWDAFDHMDATRAAMLGETCAYPASLACSTFYQASSANDWLHGNALQLTPDGNILYSVRHQDWIVKLDYANGKGSGRILWRLGKDGDFQIDSTDPSPWFSHQHDPNFATDNKSLMVFDNGNTRIANNLTGNSRGQILQVDEANRRASLMFNADLGVNSSALGTAQHLSSGNYHFDAGFIPDPDAPTTRITQALEVNASGQIVWGIQIYAQEYRSFRLTDLYTPPLQ